MADLYARGLKPAKELAANRPHGDRVRYMAGCRCDECRRANSRYESERQRARRNGDWNGIVPAERARQHLLALSAEGVGRRAVADATDLGETILCEIRAGKKKNIRARTEKLILAVTKEMALDGALVPAASTWKLLNELIADGITRGYIANRLGARTKALQLSKKRVTVRHAYQVELLYRELRMVSAGETWRLIKDLREEGYSQVLIDRRLAGLANEKGCAVPDMQPGRARVPERVAALVKHLHEQLTA